LIGFGGLARLIGFGNATNPVNLINPGNRATSRAADGNPPPAAVSDA
jgi:hypothetical protein